MRRALRHPAEAIAAAIVLAASAGFAPAAVADGSPAASVAAPPSARYVQGTPSADGTGKRYHGREIAAVMGWQGAAWLERAEREEEERTDLLLQALALAPGARVADVGAGSGFVARRLARAVGAGGIVYAVDVQPEMVRMLAERARQEGLAQIRPVLGGETDVRLRPASIDLAILVDVYHELAYPFEVLQSIAAALQPGGRVVLVEYRAEDPRVPIKALHKMSVAQVGREMAGLPFTIERVVETLPWQHIVVLKKTDAR